VREPADRSPLRGYGWPIIAVGVATAIGLSAFAYMSTADITMLYLIAIMVASLIGRGPALLAASLAVAAFDFCFIPPRFTFAVNDARYLLTFAMMFASGLVISTLAVRLRRQELRARNEELRARTEELRSSLLSAVSHDLRTPLAVITGAATTLRDDAGHMTPAAREELLSTIVDDARRLERVLSNLLQLTRVETGLVPAREWVPADEMVGAALTRLEGALRDRRVDLDIDPELILWIDPVLFEQVLINLVENAIKHGAPPFLIRAHRQDDHIEIGVGDRGPGLPPDACRLFERFVRASSAPGVGLGLAVVRAVVLAHGGTITAENAAAGGAWFRICLPAATPPVTMTAQGPGAEAAA